VESLYVMRREIKERCRWRGWTGIESFVRHGMGYENEQRVNLDGDSVQGRNLSCRLISYR
jgi:hypothetical protein